MIRKETYQLQEILPLISEDQQEKILLGEDEIRIGSHRLQLFQKSVKCVSCGIEGLFFAKEKHPKDTSYHLNLYGIKDGQEILITKDHIIPIAQKGKDSLLNYQTMCAICNQEKGHFKNKKCL